VIGVAIPLYLLQVGIKHTEPITAAIVPSLSPLVAYLPQLPVGRLRASAHPGRRAGNRHPGRKARRQEWQQLR